MKKVFGICDLDKSYVEVLTRYISRKEGSYFNVVGFSRPEALAEFVVREKFSVLLISVSFIEELKFISAGEDAIPKDTYILTEDIEPGGFKYPEVYKYQSTEAILRQILKNYERRVDVTSVLRSMQVMAVYSPIGRCGKTRYAYMKAKKLSASGETLLVSFDPCPALSVFDREEGIAGISDLLYMSATGDLANWKKTCNLKNDEKLDIVCEARRREDIRALSSEDTINFLKEIKNSEYKNIVIDVGNCMSRPEEILEMCDEIIVPYVSDEESTTKLKRWEAELSGEGRESLLKRIKKITLE